MRISYNIQFFPAINERVLAVGEAGLDKSIDTPLSVQKQAFEQQVEIAENVNKPLIIHCVRAYSEILYYRKNSNQNIPWIFHWFNSSVQTANDLIGKNCYLSFGHMLFNENSKAFKSFLSVPPENIFFETDDAGYSIVEIYNQASLLKKMPVEELKKRICTNFKNCFGI